MNATAFKGFYFRNSHHHALRINRGVECIALPSLPSPHLCWIGVGEAVVLFCFEETDEFGTQNTMRRLFVFGEVESAERENITVMDVAKRGGFQKELEKALKTKVEIEIYFWGDQDPADSVWSCSYFTPIDDKDAEKIRQHEDSKISVSSPKKSRKRQ